MASMDDLDLKEQLVEDGHKISTKAFSLIKEARKLKIGFKNAFFRSRLEGLENEYDNLFSEFMQYDNYVSSYLGMATRPFRMETQDEPTYIFTLDTERIKVLTYSYHLISQRNNLRNLMVDAGNLLSSNRNQANNNAAIIVAVISLFIAIFSLAASINSNMA
jgi:hypothetical protein